MQKDHFYLGNLVDLWVYLVQMHGATVTAEVYHVNIKPYPKCNCPDFSKVELWHVKTNISCKPMYWIPFQYFRWKETDMIIYQPTWSENDISEIVKEKQSMCGV
jgi:hypothetical protein